MLAAIVRASLANPRIVTALSLLIAAFGLAALLRVGFDVFPDFAPPRVLVQTEALGLDATQVESLVTRPLENLLAGAEGVKSVRSTSSQGLSAINVVFERAGDPYRQRQVVTERLASASGLLPAGVSAPVLSPLSSSMEYLIHFGYTSDTLDPVALRDLVQWTVKPQILAVPGVAQAQVFGGASRERQVIVDPLKLAASGFTLDDVAEATRRATALVGGGYVETDSQRIVLKAVSAGASVEALAFALIGTRAGAPVRLGDVAQVRDGAEPRFGDAIIGNKPGILIETSTQYGANTLDVTRALEARLDALAPGLKKLGVDYHPALLRPASFIESAIAKLRQSLLVGAALVVALLLVMLRDWRGALVSFSAIPLALLTTVWLLEAFGFSLNTMTLGGLVVALGVVVDDAVIDVENILRRRREAQGDDIDIGRLMIEASLEVRTPVFYATAAVAVAFLPILAMTGIQGAFFRPLSIAFLLAVALSLLVAMSATPALCVLTMGKHKPHGEAGFLAHCKRWQARVIGAFGAHPRAIWAVLIASGVIGALALPLFGARLLPDFRENYLIAHAGLRPGVSIAETARIGLAISRDLSAIPGVKSVAEQIGRAENGQDPDTPDRSEFEVQIDPSQGRGAAEIDAAIRAVFANYPNQLVEIYSVLAERIGETLSGDSAPFSVGVYGNDLERNDEAAARIAEALRALSDSGNVRLVVPQRQSELHIELKPDQLALYGLQASEALETLSAAFHGSIVANLAEADRSIPVAVRIAGVGADPQAVGGMLLRSRDGMLVPLARVATLTMDDARSVVRHEDGLRAQIVAATPRTTDQAGFAERARAVIAKLDLPAGTYLRYGGEARAQSEAQHELLLHSAAAFVLIVLLLALAFGHARHVALVLLALPSTLIGGVAAVALTGATLTLGSMVGFVALFGMAARNTILLVSHYDHLVGIEGKTWNLETAMQGAIERLTPVVLTALLTALALLPVALQMHQPGHEIEGPMAVVILGGLVSSTLVSLLLIPPLAARWLRPG